MGASTRTSFRERQSRMRTGSGQEQRRFPRLRTAWPLIVESADGRVVPGVVVDVSLSGMRIAADLDVRVGMALTLRVTLPKETGRLEVLAKVARRDANTIAVSFLTLSDDEAERLAPFLSPGDIRRWTRRVSVNLPIRIQVGLEGTVVGRTVELSTSGARVTSERNLSSGDVVVLELPRPEVGTALRLPAIVWEAYSGGAVLVFANLGRVDYLRLRGYLRHFE
jgi:PilZ domain-containing protein